MDVRLIHIDHEMPIALSAGQHVLELLDKGLPPLGVGPAEQLLGFLPRQLSSTTACFHDSLLPRQREAVQGCADRLAAAAAAAALAHRQHQPLQGPPWCRVGPLSGWGGGRTLGGADGVSKRRRNLSAKGGRPPVRRNPSASGPWAL